MPDSVFHILKAGVAVEPAFVALSNAIDNVWNTVGFQRRPTLSYNTIMKKKEEVNQGEPEMENYGHVTFVSITTVRQSLTTTSICFRTCEAL
jgi:hypothetical protein